MKPEETHLTRVHLERIAGADSRHLSNALLGFEYCTIITSIASNLQFAPEDTFCDDTGLDFTVNHLLYCILAPEDRSRFYA